MKVLAAALAGVALGVLLVLAVSLVWHRYRVPLVRRIDACHARGPASHYWQERQRCVRYTP